jgi:hypothetical protein
MATEADWESYDRAVVDVSPPAGGSFRITPAPVGEVGSWPPGLAVPVVVVTAWDPDSVPLPRAANEARHRRLVAELDRLGLGHWPATGRDPHHSHHEEGLAVPGLSGDDGVGLGRLHGQAAIYLWTPETWEVVSCTDDRRRVHGWRLTGLPGPPGPPA